eukprot:comp20091_c0_seq1/m.24746 comp20091_c0_seq1/g.24746  ORF comp20091_c0_seq1/g.24746 comp20091_c0_seq1/m.24746 type:complete len:698 (-) comp20091_c0_seq1:488-2581(-)
MEPSTTEKTPSTGSASEAQAESYDVVVVGTGLPESIVAAALARIGKKVLHVDRNEYYGGEWATFNLDLLTEWVKEHQTPVEDTGVSTSPELNPGETLFPLCGNDKTYSQITQKIHIPLEQTQPSLPSSSGENRAKEKATENKTSLEKKSEEKPKETVVSERDGGVEDGVEGVGAGGEGASEKRENETKEDENNKSAQEKTVENKQEKVKEENMEVTFADLLKEGRRFNLDLRAQLLWSKGDLVQLLISSRVGKYLEFRAIETTHLMTKKGLEQVPCSKADVFVSKVVSPVEKRFLMKFLSTCAEHGAQAEMIGEFQGRPFAEFMKHHKLSANVQQFVVYAIAMVQDDVMKDPSSLSTEEGLKLTQRFLQSLGAYGKTPFLFPAYGCAEMAQAFCRLCAVYGGVYMLRRTPTSILCQTDQEGNTEAVGLKFDDGEVVRATHVVVGPSYVSATQESQVSRGIFITDRPLATTNQTEEIDISVSVIPPRFSGNVSAVNVVQLGPKSFAAPKNKYVIHFTCKASKGTPEDDLAGVAAALFADDGDNDAPKPRVLYSLFFHQSYPHVHPPTLPSHVHVCGGCDAEMDCDSAVKKAKTTFEAIYPGEEWLPAAIDPEEIDWVASQPQQNVEGDGEKKEEEGEKKEDGDRKEENEEQEGEKNEGRAKEEEAEKTEDETEEERDGRDVGEGGHERVEERKDGEQL